MPQSPVLAFSPKGRYRPDLFRLTRFTSLDAVENAILEFEESITKDSVIGIFDWVLRAEGWNVLLLIMASKDSAMHVSLLS